MIVYLGDDAAPISRGLWLTAAVTISQLMMSFCLRHYFFKCYKFGLMIRTAGACLIMDFFSIVFSLGVIVMLGSRCFLSKIDVLNRQLSCHFCVYFPDSKVVVAVYQKALVVCAGERNTRSLGKLQNLMSIDAQRLQELTTYLHAVWYSFFQISLSLFFLWRQL